MPFSIGPTIFIIRIVTTRVRLYTGFVPYNEDMMINLALMDLNSKINLIWQLIIFLKYNR